MASPSIITPTVPVSKDEVTLDWLNSVFSPKGYQVKSFIWKGIANNGFGVMSTLERITLQLESGKTLSIILKTLPPIDSAFRTVAVSHGFAERELKMYTDLFPLWDAFQDSQNVPENFRFRRPKCYYAASMGQSRQGDYQQILILEDLLTSGFKIWSEGYGKALGWAETKPCIRLIAQFHAVGLAYRKVKGIDNYQQLLPILDHQRSASENMIEIYMQSGFDVIRKLLNEYAVKANEEQKCRKQTASHSFLPLHPMPEGCMDHLEVLRDNAFGNLMFLDPTEEQMQTVLHHDVHVNNFMFIDERGDDGREEHEVVFYDFQASMNSYPTKDLSFFLLQNCDESIITTEFEKTLQYYHDELHQAIQAMGVSFEEYTLEEVRKEYYFTALLSILHIIAGARVIYTESATDDAKRRFYNRFIHMYNDGQLKCAIFPK